MTGSTAKSIPILREDGTSLDWGEATYQARVVIGHGRGKVNHKLIGAPQLSELVAGDAAEWMVELRSPATLHASIAGSSQEPAFRFEWDPALVAPGSYVIPGLVTTREAVLDPHGLHGPWGEGPIVVPPGRWLVRGNARSAEQLGSSLIKLFPDEDLTDGKMTVTPYTGEGDLRFHVKMSPRMYRTRHHERDVQIAALIAAFGRIPGVDRRSPEDTGDEEGASARYPVLERIRDVLEDARVADWSDLSEYDPARAATEVEPFFVLDGSEDDE